MLDKGSNPSESLAMHPTDKEPTACTTCELENYDAGVKRLKEKMNRIGMNNHAVAESLGRAAAALRSIGSLSNPSSSSP